MMGEKIIIETVASLLGIWMVVFPSFFLKFLSKLAQMNYENYKSNLNRIKKNGPANLNEKLTYKYGSKTLAKISLNKKVYGPRTETQKWLMRLLGIVLICFSIGVFLNLIEFR